MNRKIIVTALVLGGAVVYALKKLTQRENKTAQPVYHRTGKHLTNVFARAKTAATNGHVS